MATSGYVSWDVFLPEILQYAHGVPTIQARIHIMQTCVEFCERSLALKKEPSTFLFDEDTALYKLKYTSDRYRAISIDEVRIGEDTNQPLSETTEKEMNSEYSNWRVRTGNKPQRFFLTENVNEVRFFPIPDQDGEDDEDVIVRTRVTYKRDQTEVDEMIYERWHEAIKSGALASLLLIPESTWYNPAEAAKHSQVYRRILRNARSTSIRGTGQFPGRVSPQSYGNIGDNHTRRSGSWV